MIWLILGVGLWSAVHFIPTIGIALKSRLKHSVGENGYKIGFSLLVVLSVVLMVVGWRATEPSALYVPADWSGPAAMVLMVVGFILFGAAQHPSRIKRFIRHPQLTGLIVWSVAHLLSNGDSRSVILFGGIGLWALLEMPLINARDGKWVKPDSPSIGIELRGLAISLAIFAVALILHPYFAGVSPMPH